MDFFPQTRLQHPVIPHVRLRRPADAPAPGYLPAQAQTVAHAPASGYLPAQVQLPIAELLAQQLTVIWEVSLQQLTVLERISEQLAVLPEVLLQVTTAGPAPG